MVLLALGRTSKEIAYALGISDSTTRVLLSRAKRRLCVRTRHELTRWTRVLENSFFVTDDSSFDWALGSQQKSGAVPRLSRISTGPGLTGLVSLLMVALVDRDLFFQDSQSCGLGSRP